MTPEQHAALTMPLEDAQDLARIEARRTITRNAKGQFLVVILAVDR